MWLPSGRPIQAQLDILKSSLETAGIKLGQALLPPFTKLVHFLAADLLPTAIRFGGMLARVFKNPYVDAFVAALLGAAVAIRTIIGLLEVWKAVEKILDIEFLTSPWGIAIIAVAALAAGIAILYARSKTFREIVSGAFRAVKDAAMDVWDWIDGHWKLLAAILLAPFAPIIAAAYGLYKLAGIVEHAFDAIKKVITGGFDSWWTGHGKELEEVWDKAWDAIKAIFTGVWDDITGIATTAWDTLMSIVRPGIDLVVDLFRIGWGAISAGTRAAWDLISGIFEAAWDVIAGRREDRRRRGRGYGQDRLGPDRRPVRRVPRPDHRPLGQGVGRHQADRRPGVERHQVLARFRTDRHRGDLHRGLELRCTRRGVVGFRPARLSSRSCPA